MLFDSLDGLDFLSLEELHDVPPEYGPSGT
jgi:hypothetical protein